MNGGEETFAGLFAWATRVAGAAVILALIGTLVWALSLSWYLPAGGAAAGAVIGWATPRSGLGKTDAALTYAVRGAAVGLSIVFVYHSGCTSAPEEPRERAPERERLVQPPSPDSS